MDWISVEEALPENEERVLVFLPDNNLYLPGKTGAMRYMPVIFLRFAENFFKPENPKFEKFGAHFWLGEGQSNHYFQDVTHWMRCPEGPKGETEKLMHN